VLFLLAGSGVLVALARYVSLRYWLEADKLVIRSGILAQRVRTIPLDKIQNVELRQNAIHQLVGVVDFRIETAAGPEAEAHLAVLSERAAKRLKSELLAGRGEVRDAADTGPATRVIWQASLTDLLLLGASSNRAGAIFGAILGLVLFVGQELPERLAALQRGLTELVGAVSPAVLASVAVTVMLLLGWLLSIALTVVGYFGFRLTREPDGRLRRRYGLLSRFETVVAPARIQLLRVEAPWLRRQLGFWEVAAHTAGSAVEGQGAGTALLCPLLRRTELAAFCVRLMPGLDLAAVTWQPVSQATLRRGFVRYLALGTALLGGVSVAVGAWAWLGVPVVALAAWGGARRRYRVLGYALDAGYLLARTGLLRRRVTIIPEGKVQWVGVRQSPPQRRYGIANLTVGTAAGVARIVDLELATALALQSELASAASAAGAWLPDAV
jgi:putative membrane protein